MDPASLVSVLLIALGLSADCFAVSLSLAASGKDVRRVHVLRAALAFGLFQMVMPVLGWLAGQTIVSFIERYDHWVAFALLAFVGVRMVIEFFRGGEEPGSVDISRWGTLAMLAFATSIDALAVGLTFALLYINIWAAAAIIGVVAFTITAAAFWMGKRIGAWLGRWSLLLGAAILIFIGVRILVEHWAG